MFHSQPEVKYEYHRTKTDAIEDGKEILFISAGIKMETAQQFGVFTNRQVKMVVSKVNCFPINQAPPRLLELKTESISYTITLNQHQLLIDLFGKDLESFYLFNPMNVATKNISSKKSIHKNQSSTTNLVLLPNENDL